MNQSPTRIKSKQEASPYKKQTITEEPNPDRNNQAPIERNVVILKSVTKYG